MPQHYRGPSPQGKTPRESKPTSDASQANGARGTSATRGDQYQVKTVTNFLYSVLNSYACHT